MDEILVEMLDIARDYQKIINKEKKGRCYDNRQENFLIE